MAVSVNVAATAIQSGIGVCQTSVHELQSAAQALESGYASAGSGWHDDKYAQLGNVVNTCTSALRSPIASLQECEASLKELLGQVQDYESVTF